MILEVFKRDCLELAGESLSSDPESFKLIKEAKTGRMVSLRVLTNSLGTPQSIFYERGIVRLISEIGWAKSLKESVK